MQEKSIIILKSRTPISESEYWTVLACWIGFEVKEWFGENEKTPEGESPGVGEDGFGELGVHRGIDDWKWISRMDDWVRRAVPFDCFRQPLNTVEDELIPIDDAICSTRVILSGFTGAVVEPPGAEVVVECNIKVIGV